MACMTHYCGSCGYEAFNNIPQMRCPECGGGMAAYFDEEPLELQPWQAKMLTEGRAKSLPRSNGKSTFAEWSDDKQEEANEKNARREDRKLERGDDEN